MPLFRTALRWGHGVLIWATLLLVAGIAMVAAASYTDDRALFTDTVGSTVAIEVAGTSDSSSCIGSGFYVTPHLLVTCAHVVDSARVCRVYPASHDTSVVLEGSVLYADTLRDVAIVYTDTTSTPLTLRTDSPPAGETIYAIGSPDGRMGSFSSGLVSNTRFDPEHRRGLIQCTAETGAGSSGGPVFDRDGQVVGIVSFFEDDAQYVFGVGAGTLRDVLVRFSLIHRMCRADPSYARTVRERVAQTMPALDDGELEAALRPAPSFEAVFLDEILPAFIVHGSWTALLMILAAVLIRRHRRLRRIALRNAMRARLEEIRSVAFLPDQLIEAEVGP